MLRRGPFRSEDQDSHHAAFLDDVQVVLPLGSRRADVQVVLPLGRPAAGTEEQNLPGKERVVSIGLSQHF